MSPQQRPDHEILQKALKSYNKGDFPAAERVFAKILQRSPNDFNALHLMGLIRVRQKRFLEAEQLIAKALEHGSSAEAFSNYGNVLSELGRSEEAIRRYRRALLIKPDYAEAEFNLGNALLKCKRPDEAVKAFSAAVRIRPGYVEALQNLAASLRELGRHAEAIASLRRALEIRPRDGELRNALGMALQEAGNLDEAEATFDETIVLDPTVTNAFYHRVRMARVKPDDALLAKMEDLARRPKALSPQNYSLLLFALGKAYEDIGRYDEAFASLLEGNRLARGFINYDEKESRQRFARLSRVFTASLLAEKAGLGSDSNVPIFVVGFPRSGTTLTEQILASHLQVHGAGEHTFVGELASSMAAGIGGGIHFPECVPGLPGEEFRSLGDLYADRLRRISPLAPRIVDKLPGNFMFLGFIHLILPNARIIHVKRDPIDTCVSCFAQRFRYDNVSFTYDLGELGRYYRLYLDLMEQWRRVLPRGAMIEVGYEDMIENLEAEARRIVDFCGLPWDERCLSFHQAERTVRTASVTQVRQPIYRSSMQRWRRYEKHLAPLIAALGDAAPRGAEHRSPAGAPQSSQEE